MSEQIVQAIIKTRDSRNTRDKLAGAFLILALCIEVFYLVNDIPFLETPQPKSPKSTLPPLAELVAARKAVRIQNAGELIWNDAITGQSLFLRQSLLTSENSRAEVAFFDGTGLVVDENSLIQIERAPSNELLGNQRIIVKLLRGSLQKRISPKPEPSGRATRPDMEIRVNDAVLSVSPSSEFVVRAANGETPIEILVQKGELPIHSPQGNAQLRQGDRAEIDRGLISRQLQFTLLSPRGDEILPISAVRQPVKFRWNMNESAGEDSPLELEVSADPDFKTVLARRTIPAASPPLKYVETGLRLPEIQEGARWYWRVSATRTGEKVASRPESFWLESEPVPELRFPLEDSQASPKKPIGFSWTSLPEAEGYQVEFVNAKNESLVSRTAEAGLQKADFSEGIWKWKVRATLRGGVVSDWSATRTFRVQSGESDLPPPPAELMDPEIRPQPVPTHSWIDFLLPSAWAEEAQTSQDLWTVHLKWSPVKGISKYRIQVSRQRNFKTILDEQESDQAETDWTYRVGMENTKGRVFYRVASINEAGKTGKYSSPKVIQIPKHILAKQKSMPEVYQAIDAAAGQPVPADAAEKRETERKALKEASPIAKSTVKVETLGAEKSWGWIGSRVALSTGIGNLRQESSESTLSSVSLDSPYLQEKLLISSEIRHTVEGEAVDWSARLEAAWAGFRKGDSRIQGQEVTPALAIKLDIERWEKSAGSGYWNFAWGGTLQRDFRWVKVGAQAVEPQGALSLGPSAAVVRNYLGGTGVQIAELGGRLSLPLTGILTGGYLGVNGSVWSEWTFFDFTQNWLGLRIEAEARYTRWSAPSGTGLFAWTTWLAPTFHFEP